MTTFLKLVLGALLLAAVWPTPQTTQAVGETSTKFGIFVPPNGENRSRDPMLVVTAVRAGPGTAA